MRALSFLVVVLAACGSERVPDDPRAPCMRAVSADVDAIAKRRGNTDVVDQQLKDELTTLCVTAKWSDATLGCFTSAPDHNKCRAMLTPEQRTDYTKARMRINSRRVGRPTLPAGSGSAQR